VKRKPNWGIRQAIARFFSREDLRLHIFLRKSDQFIGVAGLIEGGGIQGTVERSVVLNKIILHMEGSIVFALCIYFYFSLGFSWITFLVFLFTPDISALAYLKNNKVGSTVYNLFHTYCLPMALLLYGVVANNDIVLMMSLIWIAHIGMDRMFGYGLKYPTKFQDTHLNRV